MAYNSNKGTQNFGDIHYEGDPAETQIDFEDDLIALKTNNVQRLIVSSSAAITASIALSCSVGITASTFSGDGGGLTGIPAAGVVAAGATTQVLYNNAGTVAGSANMTFNGTTLTVAGLSSTGNTTLGDEFGDSLTINAQTIDIPNVAAGTDNTVVVYNGSTLLTDEIDSRVWESYKLIERSGTPLGSQVAVFNGAAAQSGYEGLTYVDNLRLAVSGTISGSGNISGSAFYGDGTNLTNTGIVTTYNNPTDNYVLTSAGAGAINGEANLTFDGSKLGVAGNVSASINVSGNALYVHGETIELHKSTGGHAQIKTTSQHLQLRNTANDKNIRIQLGDDGGNTEFQVRNNSAVTKMKINSLGNSEFYGNVSASAHLSASALYASSSHLSRALHLTGTLKIGTGIDTATSTKMMVSGTGNSVLGLWKSDVAPCALGITGSGQVTIGGQPTLGHLHLDAKLNTSGSDNDKLISLKSDSHNPAFYVSGSGDVYAAGKLGVNTTSPTHTLSVTGAAEISGDTTVRGAFRAKTLEYNTIQFNYGGTSEIYIPFAGVSELVNATYQQQWVAPFNGALKRLLVRTENSQSGNITGSIYVGVDGDPEIDQGGVRLEVASGSNSATYTTTTINFTGSNHFAAGDLLGVTIQPRLNPGKINLTMIWEFDTTTF